MASSSSSSSPLTWRYNVFTSFHGPDVRKTFLSHLRKQFNRNGITMFDDQGIERSLIIAPALTQAIQESRISIVVLSKNYASSSWCLDELVEIFKCKEDMRQIVMTVFYGVDPSDVRKQTGDFGIAFNETCARKTEEERLKWSQALKDVGNIAGEHFLNWVSEADMVEKIARDVSNKLNATPSKDFDSMVGLEAHLREMESLLDLDYDGVKIVAISGPAGIGKTTIARALQTLHSNKFQLTCFVDNLRESYHSGLDDYGLQLHLQEQFLSKILNQNGMKIYHQGVIKGRLHDQRVFIILDDVSNLKQLEALANETTWFGPGSRIVVTTENKELLQQHGINNTYHVGFPSREEALEILCTYAFTQSYPHNDFKELALRVTELCGNLPLGLRVVGSSLRGKNEEEWEEVICRLDTILHREIDDVLRVGYENLDENEQTLFLLIAIFLNYKDGYLVKTMFADSDLDVKHGLKLLVNRSLIDIFLDREIIVMHRLLQQVGKNAIHKQEPWKRRILVDTSEICDVLEHAKGTRNVVGISFDISRISEVSISKKAFKVMPELRFLKVYKSKDDGNDRVHIPEKMELPRRLRLLQWEEYPNKCLPPTFHLEYLVELDMKQSKLEYLWQGTLPLTNLKKVNLEGCFHLKELPDLSNATNLETLNLNDCKSLVEIPSSCSHLHKLESLLMDNCINLEIIPPNMNLASLEIVEMGGCTRLRNIPVMSTNIKQLVIAEAAVEDLPASNTLWSRLWFLDLRNNRKLKEITHLPPNLKELDLRYSDIESIPDCIKALHWLEFLCLSSCTRLASLPELPASIIVLYADDCESLETVFSPWNCPNAFLNFSNCFKLCQRAKRAIIQPCFFLGVVVLPGREVPAEFDHRGRGNSLTIRPDGNLYSRFVFCVVISSKQQEVSLFELCIDIAQDGFDHVEKLVSVDDVYKSRKEHLLIFDSRFLGFYPSDMSREIVLEFSSQGFDIIECGAKILTEESHETGLDQVLEDEIELEPNEAVEDEIELEPSEAVEDDIEHGEPTIGVGCDSEKQTDCWSWIFLCCDLSHFVSNIRGLASGRRPTTEAGS